MPGESNSSNVERLYDLAIGINPEELRAQGIRAEEGYNGMDVYANFGNGLEVARVGAITVLTGTLDITGSAEEQPFTISFTEGSSVPDTFMDWNRISKRDHEGSLVPKRQREKIAARFIELFAA